MGRKLLHVALLLLTSMVFCRGASSESAALQPVSIEIAYHHFPTAALKEEFLANLGVILKERGCQSSTSAPLKAYERPNNVSNFSLGLKGTVNCKIGYCAKSKIPSELLLTFYDDGSHSQGAPSITQFELVDCGSPYRTVYRFAGQKMIGFWADSQPNSESFRWNRNSETSTISFYEAEGTMVREIQVNSEGAKAK